MKGQLETKMPHAALAKNAFCPLKYMGAVSAISAISSISAIPAFFITK